MTQLPLPIKGYTLCDSHPLAPMYAELHKWQKAEEDILSLLEDPELEFTEEEWETLESNLLRTSAICREIVSNQLGSVVGFWTNPRLH